MIWPFTKLNPHDYKVPEFKSITFGKWQYAPAPDITVYELAILAPIFGTIMVRTDIKTYIEKNNLTIHFKIHNEE